MFYYLFITGFVLARIVPRKICYLIGAVIAWLYFIFSRKDRKILRENLKYALGEGIPDKERDRHVRAIFTNFAKYLADFFRFPRYTEEYISRNIEVTGRENLDQCIREGNGAVIVTLHLGNWELGAALVGGLGYDLYVIALEHSNPRINDFFISQRAINGVKSIPPGASVKGCFKAISKNNIVAIAADKDYTSTGVEVDFFGRKAFLPRGAAVIALKTGAPIVFTVLTREKGDRYKLVFEKPIKRRPTSDKETDIKGLIGEYALLFEKYIHNYPDQWYAFKPIWDQR